MAGPDPGPGLAPGSAPVEPATVLHAGHWVPALPWDAPRPSGFATSGSAAAASPHSGPHLFKDLCALVTIWSKNGFRSCDGNSVFSRDLILNEVSESNGIARIIVRSVCEQF